MNGRLCLVIAGIAGASAVGMGAFHAHGLEGFLASAELEPAQLERRLELVGTAYRYQMLHAVVLITLAVLLRTADYGLAIRLAPLAFVNVTSSWRFSSRVLWSP